jgi:carbon-monoxide dehydrogenase medium subunit
MLDLQQGHHPPVHSLVDLTFIPELRTLEVRGDELVIGAGVPHNRIVDSPLAQQHAQALVEACGLIGGPQVRNMATLGGNVAHALPAADGTIGLMSLNAQVEIASPAGRRRVPLWEIFVGPGKSSLDSKREILVSFAVPLCKPHQASAFCRVMRAQGIALPILNLAVWLERTEGKISDIHVAVGPAGPVPFRAIQTEGYLRGKSLSAQTIAGAQETLLGEAVFRTSPARATAEYRRQLVVVLLKNALATAWDRAASE